MPCAKPVFGNLMSSFPYISNLGINDQDDKHG